MVAQGSFGLVGEGGGKSEKRALELAVVEKDEKSVEKINRYHNEKQATII